MKLPLVGPSSEERSITFDASRTINLYPVMDESGQEPAALYGTPGLLAWDSTTNSPGRGIFNNILDDVYHVSDTAVYRVNGSTNGYQFMGDLLTDTGYVTFADNGLQLAICDGTYLYTITYATDTLAQVTSIGLPASVGSVTFIDGYFVVNENATGKFYISALYDGTTWDALDFATAESSPDNLLRPINAQGQLWLLGKFTSEIWYNSGAQDFPFERVSGGKMEVGILSPDTALAIDNSLFWVGQSFSGRGVVYRANGFSPQRISTSFVERQIQAATSFVDAPVIKSFSYEEDGHVFYCITGEDMETTLCYDLTTQLWHERAWLNGQGDLEPHLVNDVCDYKGVKFCSNRRNGDVYWMSLDYFTDDWDKEIVSERIFPTIGDEDNRKRYNKLALEMETGVGRASGRQESNEPATVNPVIELYLSGDGGHTWSGPYSKEVGREGQYDKHVAWRRLGYYKSLTVKLRFTDMVKRALIGAYLS